MKKLLTGLAVGTMMLGIVGFASAANITNGFTYAVASGSNQLVGTHFHSNTGGAFGNPAGLAEVGSFASEEVRGLAEFNITGLPVAAAAFLTFNVYGTGLFEGVNNFPFTGTIDIFGFRGNNLEDISDYHAASGGGAYFGSFSTVGLSVGDVLSFDMTGAFNFAINDSWTSQAVRLQTENTSTNGGAWVFNDFRLTTTNDSTKDPVPEPATMLLFGTGLAGLAAVRRRKMKA